LRLGRVQRRHPAVAPLQAEGFEMSITPDVTIEPPRARAKARHRVATPRARNRSLQAPASMLTELRQVERLEQVETAVLRAYQRNARVHTAKQVTQLAASIREFGFVNPVIADAANLVVAGHGRLAAAKQLGMTTVPVIRLEHLKPEQIRAYRIADNRLAELSDWDEELLALELQDLSELELAFDLDVVGFATAEIDELIAGLDDLGEDELEDEPPQPQDRAVARPGDLWLLGPHRLLCADARDPAAYQRLLGAEQTQLVVTDPPYNVRINGHVCGLGKTAHREFAMASGEMSRDEFVAFLSSVLTNMAIASKDGAIHFVFMDWAHAYELLQAGHEVYAELKNICVWAKTNAGMGSFYRSQTEFVFAWKNGTARHINNFGLGETGRWRSNLWTYAGLNTFRRGRAEELAAHPTVKPVALVMDVIKDCSHRGGIVLDAFGGSGTTLIAAHRTGRVARLLEIDPLYVDVIIRRWQALSGEQALHADSSQTFAGRAQALEIATPGETAP
jgi:DNA modification methylase